MMKKTKFFSEDSIEKLQRNVNVWLSKNKSIAIVRTDMQVASVANKASYCFYILYEVMERSAQMAMAERMEAVVSAEGEEPVVQLTQEQIIPPDKEIFNKV